MVARLAPLSMGILQARILEWVAMPSSRGSSQPRDRTQVSRIADRFFTVWTTREAHEYWSGLPIPSSGDLPNPGIEPGSPALQVDSFSAKLAGNPMDIFNSVQFRHSVVSDSLQPHEPQHARLSCPSPTPRACSNSCPLSCWCHPTISSSVVPFCPQSFPASGSFQMSHFFTSGGQSTGVPASASVLPMNIQDWFPLEWTGWISLHSKGFSRVFSNTTVQKHQFFGAQPSSQSNSHIHTWPLEKP